MPFLSGVYFDNRNGDLGIYGVPSILIFNSWLFLPVSFIFFSNYLLRELPTHSVMSELSFAKSFLSTLDSRPIKLRADHVFDPEQVGLRVPVSLSICCNSIGTNSIARVLTCCLILQYTLPRLSAPHPPMPKKVKSAHAPGSSKSITVRVKSARNPALDFPITNAPLSTTSVQDIRDAVRGRVTDPQGGQVPLEKIKILYKRKPVTGTGKTLAEMLVDEPTILAGGKEVEIGIMIIGGAQAVESSATQPEAPEKRDESPPKPAVGPSGEEVLRTEAFWDDLQGYLEQRLKDEAEAKHLRSLFKDAWKSSN